MIVFVESRVEVAAAYRSQFEREGMVLHSLGADEFQSWLADATRAELGAVECYLIGAAPERTKYVRSIRARSPAAVIALSDQSTLETTLDLFACGVDDVVRKPVHVREILARLRAIQRRAEARTEAATAGPVRVFFDGRDPEIDGDAFPLPRRERRILEFLASHRGKRVTKAQIFHSIYGLFDDEVEETVVESHVSKLRRKLKARIGYDLIDSKRFLGYRLLEHRPAPASRSSENFISAQSPKVGVAADTHVICA